MGPTESIRAVDKTAALREIYRRLLASIGPRSWWPADTPFEVMVGAVLTQNTAWSNVEKAIRSLKDARLMNPAALGALPTDRLARLIRPAGYYNVKAGRLKNLVDLILEAGGGDPPLLLEQPLASLRERLLAVNGIGPETADSILLYAARYPIFVVDTYTRRILSRHGLVEEGAAYDHLQALFMDHLPHDTPMFNEYHALLDAVGHRYCKPQPRCEDCPLKDFRIDNA